MKSNDLTIKKHSALIQINVRELTAIQRKIINALIYMVQQAGNKETYSTTISIIKKMCKILSTENIDLKEQLKSLMHIIIEFNYLGKDKTVIWEGMPLLSGAKVVPNEGLVEFSFSPFLKEKILNPRIYAPLNVKLVAGLKSSYSIIFYEFLRDYLMSPAIPIITIEGIRDLTGIQENEYKEFADFKRRVINVAVREINKKTDIKCSYRLIKEEGKGNRYSGIQFKVEKNDKFESDSYTEIEGTLELGFNVTDKSNNKSTVQISEDILSEVPEKHRTKAIIELITKYLGKGPEYIVSNIKYTVKKVPEKFSAYLNQAFENDYASNDREVEANQKVKTEKIVKHKAEAEKKVLDDRNNTEKKLEAMRQLSDKKREKLKERAITIIKVESPNNEYALKDIIVEMKMADLYMADCKINGYVNNDSD